MRQNLVGDTHIDSVVHSIVTTTPNDMTKAYHHRMPVILAADDYEEWLTGSPDDAFGLLRPSPAVQMQMIQQGQGMREGP